VGGVAAGQRLLRQIFSVEQGFTLALNLSPYHLVDQAVSLRLLPDMIFHNRFTDLAVYRQLLRSPWRRRLDRTRERFKGVQVTRSGCSDFTEEHYGLYLQVMERATERLEILGLGFFQGLPRPLELVSCRQEGRLLCWRLMLLEDRRLSFVLGGHDYQLNKLHDSYFNSLLGVLADGMAAGIDEIELGQTAEDPKARLGAQPVEKCMLLAHSNLLIHQLMKLASPWIAYRHRPAVYSVFKKEIVFS
jgi:hypothetical protein